MIKIKADNLKPGDILLNVGLINTVKLTKNHVEITIVGAAPTDSERYFKPDELVYLHEEFDHSGILKSEEIPESGLSDDTLLP